MTSANSDEAVMILRKQTIFMLHRFRVLLSLGLHCLLVAPNNSPIDGLLADV